MIRSLRRTIVTLAVFGAARTTTGQGQQVPCAPPGVIGCVLNFDHQSIGPTNIFSTTLFQNFDYTFSFDVLSGLYRNSYTPTFGVRSQPIAIFNNGTMTMTSAVYTGGTGLFNFFGFGFASYLTDQTISVFGYRGSEQVFSQSLVASASFNSFFTTNWANVTSVVFQGAPTWFIDDIVVSSIPEPAAIALLATGLVVLAGTQVIRRRKKTPRPTG